MDSPFDQKTNEELNKKKKMKEYKRRILWRIIIIFSIICIIFIEQLLNDYIQKFEIELLLKVQQKVLSPLKLENKFIRDFFRIFIGRILEFPFNFLITTHIVFIIYFGFNPFFANKLIFVFYMGMFFCSSLILIYQGPRPFWINHKIIAFPCIRF